MVEGTLTRHINVRFNPVGRKSSVHSTVAGLVCVDADAVKSVCCRGVTVMKPRNTFPLLVMGTQDMAMQ